MKLLQSGLLTATVHILQVNAHVQQQDRPCLPQLPANSKLQVVADQVLQEVAAKHCMLQGVR